MPAPEFRQVFLPHLPVIAVGGHSDQRDPEKRADIYGTWCWGFL